MDPIDPMWPTNITPRQQVALRHTCRLPDETLHPRFRLVGGGVSTILTLNSGFE